MCVNLLITGALFCMVVNNPAGLQMRIHCYRAKVLKAISFELPGNLIRQTVADRNPSVLVPHVQNRFSVGMFPEPVAETAMLLPDPLKASGVIDYRFDFPAGTDHSIRVHDAVDIRFGIGSDTVVIEAVKAGMEDLPLLDHQTPGKTALHGFHHQMLEHAPVIMHRYTPLGVVVNLHGFKREAPIA